MDGSRFDDLSRKLAAGVSRRTALKGAVAGAIGALGLRKASAAPVTQATCGNVVCASNPGLCNDACVCCVYSNGNSRCRPPGTCGSGQQVCPPGKKFCANLNKCAVCCVDDDCAAANACTTNTCNAGVCASAPLVCNDNNDCTTDTCVPATGCVYTPVVCDAANQICNPTTGQCFCNDQTNAICGPDQDVCCAPGQACDTSTSTCGPLVSNPDPNCAGGNACLGFFSCGVNCSCGTTVGGGGICRQTVDDCDNPIGCDSDVDCPGARPFCIVANCCTPRGSAGICTARCAF